MPLDPFFFFAPVAIVLAVALLDLLVFGNPEACTMWLGLLFCIVLANCLMAHGVMILVLGMICVAISLVLGNLIVALYRGEWAGFRGT